MARDRGFSMEDDEMQLIEEELYEEETSYESDEEELAAIEHSGSEQGGSEDDEYESHKQKVTYEERKRLREDERRRREAAIDADLRNKAKRARTFLLQQNELFAHFLDNTASKTKKPSSKQRIVEEEEENDDANVAEMQDAVTGGRLFRQPSCIKGKMREYQVVAMNWLIRLHENGINGILADEMGLGKTLQTIALLAHLHEIGLTGPHMVVAPKSTLGNWMNEFQRFCPTIRAFKFHGATKEERIHLRENELLKNNFDVCVTSYEVVRREKPALKKFRWRYIIIDEAHRIKNEFSDLSKTMREFSTNYKLLITGTPLQNNLHELWSLLNFLLPDIFSSAGVFDEWFKIESAEEHQKEAVQKLHQVLRPFLLRRLKADVEHDLPRKKETILKVGMSKMQKEEYRNLLSSNKETITSGDKNKKRSLLNIAMQLRKCCNHPYLFPDNEPKINGRYVEGEHLVENSGKLVLLDKLLPKLQSRDSRVLLFSQMTRLLDIIEDYCRLRKYKYCRIDGNTTGEDRELAIEEFNKEGSEQFIFLLSTRAGGLGINLPTADIVILYDNDWNPQVDLQAQDRAHRIGQTKEVQVFRFCTEHTIEEKVIERAYKKLALDALVIQEGRQITSDRVKSDELVNMVSYGAEMIFSANGCTITDDDIDRIIAKGEAATAELDAKMKKFTQDAIQFKLDDATTALYGFDDVDEKEDVKNFKKLLVENVEEPAPRPRKRNYSEIDYYKEALRITPTKPREQKAPQVHDFQFFDNRDRLNELYEKEWKCQPQQKEAGDMNIDPLTPVEMVEKEMLLKEGFQTWTRRDFQAFLRACEKHGRSDVKRIARDLEGKSEEEVERYAQVFGERHTELNDYERIIKGIEKGELRLARKDEITLLIRQKMESYKDPLQELKIQYGQNKSKLYTEDFDRFMICMTHELGYGNWDELKNALRIFPLFQFDWFVKSRTTVELARRCETLVRLIEKEQEPQQPELLGRKKSTKNGGASSSEKEEAAPSKRRKQAGGTAPSSKRRK